MSFCCVWSFLVLTEADCLAELLVCRFLFSPPPHTHAVPLVLNASPSAHDQSCSSALQTACQASGRSTFISGGAALCPVQSLTNRWRSRVEGAHRWKNTLWRGKLDGVGNFAFSLVFVFQDLLRGELNAVCATLRFFLLFSPPFLHYNKTGMEVVIKSGASLDVQWEYY